MIKYGDRVAVTTDSTYSFLKNEIGVVIGESDNSIKVKFPIQQCDFTADGAYWIPADELFVVDEFKHNGLIDRIIFNGPATIILWKDWSKTVAICSENDIYDPYIGFCIAFTKKHLGNTSEIKNLIDVNNQNNNGTLSSF